MWKSVNTSCSHQKGLRSKISPATLVGDVDLRPGVLELLDCSLRDTVYEKYPAAATKK
jgi:hypothetical protein